jgi:hypothetical protein
LQRGEFIVATDGDGEFGAGGCDGELSTDIGDAGDHRIVNEQDEITAAESGAGCGGIGGDCIDPGWGAFDDGWEECDSEASAQIAVAEDGGGGGGIGGRGEPATAEHFGDDWAKSRQRHCIVDPDAAAGVADFASEQTDGASGFINNKSSGGARVIGDGIENPDGGFEGELPATLAGFERYGGRDDSVNDGHGFIPRGDSEHITPCLDLSAGFGVDGELEVEVWKGIIGAAAEFEESGIVFGAGG